MACCARVAPALLIHANLLLCMVAGAGLATAARLKWDPSTYVVGRALLPLEYRAAAAALCAASAALLLLAHLAAAALCAASAALLLLAHLAAAALCAASAALLLLAHLAAAALCAASAALLLLAHLAAAALLLRTARPRLARYLLITYAVCMAGLAAGEAGWAGWTAARLVRWLRSEQAAQVLDLLQLRDQLRPLLAFLARYHPLPDHLADLMEEAEADAPRNMYVGGAAVLLAALLQPAAALLALLSAATSRPARASTSDPDSISYSIASTESEKAPLRTAYRNGRLVIV